MSSVKLTNTRIQFAFYISICTIIWILCCLNTDNADYIVYRNYYYAYGTGDFQLIDYHMEWAYRLLCQLFYNLGFSFVQFRIFFMSIVLFLTSNSIWKYAKNPVLILILYFIYPFFVQCVQIRNAMAISLIIYALRFLNKKYGVIKYIAFVLIASLFHVSAIVYLLLALKKDNSFCIKAGILGALAVAFINIFLMPTILQIFANATGNTRFLRYSGKISLDIAVKHMIPMALLYLILLYCYCSRGKNINNYYGMLSFQIVMLSLIYIPFIIIDINYSRLYYFLLPIYYIAISNLASQKSRIVKNDNVVINIFCVSFSIFMFYMLIGPRHIESFSEVTIAIFKNNFLLELLKNF